MVLFAGSRRYVRASIGGLWSRRIALVLCLFYISPAWVLVNGAHLTHWAHASLLQSIDTEIWPVIYLWGYPFTAIAVGVFVFALLAYERDRRMHRVGVVAPLLGLVCAWLQPWQAATLIGMVVLTELLLRLRGERGHLALPVAMVTATAAPSSTTRCSATWIGRGRSPTTPTSPCCRTCPGSRSCCPWPPWGSWRPSRAYRPPKVTFHELAIRLWPLIALVQYLAIYFGHVGTFPLHSLDGLEHPLRRAGRDRSVADRYRIPRRAMAIVASVVVLALVIPSGIQELHAVVWGVQSTGILGPQPALISPDVSSMPCTT